MNAVYGGIAVALIGAIATVLGYWVKRTDNATKLTADNVRRMKNDVGFIGALLDDNVNNRLWMNEVRQDWRAMQLLLRDKGSITEIHDLPPLPESRVEKLQAQRARAEANED